MNLIIVLSSQYVKELFSVISDQLSVISFANCLLLTAYCP